MICHILLIYTKSLFLYVSFLWFFYSVYLNTLSYLTEYKEIISKAMAGSYSSLVSEYFDPWHRVNI